MVSPLSHASFQCPDAPFTWPPGVTSWLSEPLPPRSSLVSLADSLPLPSLLVSWAVCDQGNKISSPTSRIATTLFARIDLSPFRRRHTTHLISSPRNYYPASSLLFFPPRRHLLHSTISAILSILLSLIQFILPRNQLRLHPASHIPIQALPPVRQLWHVLVP